ncbi:MAG: HD domain-containing protein, partial [Bryobacterales bacterium]|nr:HD domain-containing protein [Bryobacterales bacterium]
MGRDHGAIGELTFPESGSDELRTLHPVAQAAYQDLEDRIRAARPWEDLSTLRYTFDYANWQHRQQVRDSGEPYILHPLGVASLLFEMQMDLTSIQSGLLHDAVEDTGATAEDVTRLFGEHVA